MKLNLHPVTRDADGVPTITVDMPDGLPVMGPDGLYVIARAIAAPAVFGDADSAPRLLLVDDLGEPLPPAVVEAVPDAAFVELATVVREPLAEAELLALADAVGVVR